LGGAGSVVDGLLELRPGAEAWDPRRRDVNRLAGTGMLALAGAALGNVELAEAGEGNLAPATERLLDRLADGVDGLLGLLLGTIGVLRDLIAEFRLRHWLLPKGSKGEFEANNARGRLAASVSAAQPCTSQL